MYFPKRGRPSFGTGGPALNQRKIVSINQEHVVPMSKTKAKKATKIKIKLKDLILVNKKLTDVWEPSMFVAILIFSYQHPKYCGGWLYLSVH